MAIDQRDVSSKLRFMDDRALQQYAAMHKSDPYIFPLAFQESQNRQRLRMQQQAQAGAQEQPKVADQALAQMSPQQAQPMPETQGIATLPAPNMKFGAEGGIMGYEGYDEGANDFSQEPVLRMAEGGVARYQVGGTIQSRYQQESQEMGMGTRMQYSPDVQAYAQAQEQASREGYAERERQNMLRGPHSPVAQIAPAPSTTPATAPIDYDPAENLKKLAKTDKYVSAPAPNSEEEARLLNRYPTTKPAAKKDDAAPKADTGRPAPTRAATDPSAKPETGGLDSLVAKLTRDTELAQGALRNQRVGQAALLEDEAKGAKEEGEKSRKERGDVFKGKEERLAAREKGIEGLGDKYMGLALLQAGAAMMSTPGNIGTAIGKGIQVGSERYIAGIDKINAAKDKFAEARDRLDDLRINRDDMNAKEIRDENRAIRNARIQGQQLMVDGATKDLEMNNANFREFFRAGAEDIKTNKEIAARKEISAMDNAARARIAQLPQGNERIATLLGNGDLAKGLAKFTEIQAGKFNPTTAYTDYISKRKEGDTVLTPQEFVTQIRSIQALMAGAPSVSNKPTGKAFE
jgi:hypothetical protein